MGKLTMIIAEYNLYFSIIYKIRMKSKHKIITCLKFKKPKKDALLFF